MFITFAKFAAWKNVRRKVNIQTFTIWNMGEQASRQAGKQVLGLQFSFLRILDFFQPFRLLF